MSEEPREPTYTCPRCRAVSHNPHDIENKYCGRCHQFEDIALLKAALHALRSYQYGNNSPDLAKEVADRIEQRRMTDKERIALLEKAQGPEDIRKALKGLTPEELAEMGFV